MSVHCWCECKMVQLPLKIVCFSSTQKIRNRFTIRSDKSSVKYQLYTVELKAGSQRHICTLLFIAGLFTITKRKKESEVAQSCLTLCDPMDCSLQGSSLHGILRARVLEWVAISFSRGSPQLRDRNQVFRIPGRRF